MTSNSTRTPASPKTIVLHTVARSMGPHVTTALRKLGYAVISVHAGAPAPAASLRIVDEQILGAGDLAERQRAAAAIGSPHEKWILLTGVRSSDLGDPRVVGQLSRPASLQPLYAMAQTALESAPRSAPRLATRLSARAIRADRRTLGAVTSISATGCLFVTHEPIEAGATLTLQLAMPDQGIIHARAECVHSGPTGAGLRLQEMHPREREGIARFVASRLAQP